MPLVGPIINNDHSLPGKLAGKKEQLLFCGKLFFFLFLSKKHTPQDYSTTTRFPPEIKQRCYELDEKDCKKKEEACVQESTNRNETQLPTDTHQKEKLTEYSRAVE